MKATEILDQLHDLGVSIRLDGPNVRLDPAEKVPDDLLAEAKAHKADIIRELRRPYNAEVPSEAKPETLETLMARLQLGQTWLLDQHRRWQADDPNVADHAEFSRVWNAWWELDEQLRTGYGLEGCVFGADGSCPDGFPCLGCADLPAPAVVAQLALA